VETSIHRVTAFVKIDYEFRYAIYRAASVFFGKQFPMPKKPLLAFSFFLIATLSLSQKPTITIREFESATPYTHLDLNNDPEQFHFAVVTDRTGGHRPGVFEDGVEKLNLLQPEFVMSVGDLIEGYTEDMNTLTAEWQEFDAFVNALEMPFFYVPGNHDITNEVMEKLWIEKFGATYYHFVYKDVLFLCLNSEDQKRGAGRGTISDAQYEFVKKTLADHPDVKWTLVFMHQPLWVQENTERWPDVEALLSDRKHNVFAGHYHNYIAADRNNGKYIMLATTGGGSALRGPQLGEFDHFMWITMKPTGPLIANVALNGVFDEDLFTAESAELASTIEDMDVVQIEPLLLDDLANFQESELQIKLKNDLDIPVTVNLRERFNWDLTGKMDRNEITINPNSVEFAKLTLRKRVDLKTGDFSPFVLESTVTVDTDEKSIEIPGRYLIKPLEKHTLRSSKKKKIDGKLNDWDELTHFFQAESEGGNEVRFDLSYDDDFLYVAAEVKDDEVMNSGKGAPWTQDYIGFALNGEVLPKSAMSKGKHWYANEVYFLISPEIGSAPALTHPQDRIPETAEYKCLATDDGYLLEMKMPLDYIKSKQGEEWKSFRFNLMTGDKNTDGQTEMTFWQNDWRGSENVVGSGVFVRE